MTLIWFNKNLNICSGNHIWLFSGLTLVVCAKRSGDAICNRDANYCLCGAAENGGLRAHLHHCELNTKSDPSALFRLSLFHISTALWCC